MPGFLHNQTKVSSHESARSAARGGLEATGIFYFAGTSSASKHVTMVPSQESDGDQIPLSVK